MMQLETINYDCYCYMEELLVVKNDPHEEIASLDGVKKGFLLNKNLGDSRKKLFDAETKTSQSNINSKSNFQSLDGYKLLEHEKQILGLGCNNRT